MPIITLTTDFGTRDYSVAAVKAALLSKIPNVVIVDVSHAVSLYNIVEAAYILKSVYLDFPKGSIHIIGVNAEKTPLHKHLLIELNGHYFIGADSGIFSLLAEDSNFTKIISFKHPLAKNSIFPTKDVFVAIAKQISEGVAIESIGTPIVSVKKWVFRKPDISAANELIGHVIYIDHFGNVVTDISKEIFEKTKKTKTFTILVSSVKLSKVYVNYDAITNYKLPASDRVRPGQAMAVFNANGFLEIALYKSDMTSGGTAYSLLGMRVGDSVKIVFE